MNQKDLKRAIENLSWMESPRRDLWPGIRNQLSRSPESNRRRILSLTFAALILGLVTGGLLTATLLRPKPENPILVLEQRYQSLKPVALELMGQHSPEARVILERELDSLDQATERVMAALRQFPDDQELLAAVYVFYERKYEFLREVVVPLQG